MSQRSRAVAQNTMSRPDIFNAFDEAMIGELDNAFDPLVNNAEEAREGIFAFADKRTYNREKHDRQARQINTSRVDKGNRQLPIKFKISDC